MLSYDSSNKRTCLNCKYRQVTDKDELYCELAEEITDEEDICEDYEEE